MERLRLALLRYFHENFDDLLVLDLKIARLLGAPAPHTLSSWAYLKSPFWTDVIDDLFLWFLGQEEHCRKDYERVTNGIQREAEKDQRTE